MSNAGGEELLKAGQLDEALAAVRDCVRKEPADARHRRFLFQLLSIVGQWEKALTQLDVLADLDADSKLMAQAFRQVVACEMLRADVFKGIRTPLILGEPQEWMGLLLHGNTLAGQGKLREAREIFDRALEDAPGVSGSINEHSFEWIADADSRFGPVLEAVIDGKYYWVPFNRITTINIARPTDLRDLVWISANFTWVNGGESPGLIPVRYPGSEASPDNAIRLSRKTDWRDVGEGFFFGEGQRLFATDEGEYPLLETLVIKLNQTPIAPVA